MSSNLTDLERFEKHHVKIPECGCWLWTGGIGKDGYGKFHVGSRKNMKTIRAHRWAYEHFIGPLGDMLALHHCDVPSCVNPSHLFSGTTQDNVDDKMAKGRYRGPPCKINQDIADSIRVEVGTDDEIGARYGITGAYVCMIKKNQYWVKP